MPPTKSLSLIPVAASVDLCQKTAVSTGKVEMILAAITACQEYRSLSLRRFFAVHDTHVVLARTHQIFAVDMCFLLAEHFV